MIVKKKPMTAAKNNLLVVFSTMKQLKKMRAGISLTPMATVTGTTSTT